MNNKRQFYIQQGRKHPAIARSNPLDWWLKAIVIHPTAADAFVPETPQPNIAVVDGVITALIDSGLSEFVQSSTALALVEALQVEGWSALKESKHTHQLPLSSIIREQNRKLPKPIDEQVREAVEWIDTDYRHFELWIELESLARAGERGLPEFETWCATDLEFFKCAKRYKAKDDYSYYRITDIGRRALASEIVGWEISNEGIFTSMRTRVHPTTAFYWTANEEDHREAARAAKLEGAA